MSCSLTTGYALGCRDAVGGIKTIYVQTLNATGSVNTNGSGLVTGFTPTSVSGSWFEYDLTKATSSMTETLNASTENGTLFYTPEVTFTINKLQTSVRNELRLLARNRLLVIVLDNNGLYWLLGAANGLEASAGTAGTGTAFGDRSGYEMTLTGMEPDAMLNILPATFSASTNQISGS
jgi:hypothetical protein